MKYAYLIFLVNIVLISQTIQSENLSNENTTSNESQKETDIPTLNFQPNNETLHSEASHNSHLPLNNTERKGNYKKTEYAYDPVEHMEGNIHGNEEYGEKIKHAYPSDIDSNSKAMTGIENMITRWHNEMGSFGNADIFTIEIKGKETRTFLLNIKTVPSTMKGGFVISAKGLTKFHLSIYSPSGFSIFKSENKREDLFKVIVSESGQYRISLTNNNYFVKIEVWIILDIERETPLISSTEASDNLYPIESRIDILEKNLNDLIVEQRFFDARHKKFRENVSYVRWKSVIISFISTFVVVALTGWQLCFIKRLVESKQANRFGL